MKTRRIETSGGPLTIAPLRFGEVEQLLDPEAPQNPWRAILQALANAGETIALGQLKQMLDLADYRTLFGAVLDLSDLKSKETDDTPDEPIDFGYLRSRLVANLGWTFDQVDAAPFPYVMRLFKHWNEFPPVDLLFQGFVGYKPKAAGASSSTDSSPEEKATLVGMWGGQVKSGDWLPPAIQASLARDMGGTREPSAPAGTS